jgi:hypothetical protein
MPARIPRTEYSAESHWDLIRAVTGIDVQVESSEDTKSRAQVAFMKAWNYDLFWSTLIGHGDLGEWCTDMGHAEYAAGGVDRRDTIHCPFDDPEQVLNFDPWDALGEKDVVELTRRFEDHYAASCAVHDFGVNMTGVYITLISGFIGLFGWDMLLLAAGTDRERFGALALRYASWIQQYFDALAAADVPVVMVHDDMVWASGPIFNPNWYREVVFPNYARFFSPLIDSGKKVLFTSDGNFTAFIDDLAATGIHGSALEPLTDLDAIVERYGQTHVIIGNADTRVLLTGSKASIRAEVERCMEAGRRCPGFFMAVGNHIPSNTPVESAIYYNEVYEELCGR